MKTTIIATALLAAAAVPALADGTPPPAPDKNVCLLHSEIDGWGSRDAHSLIINDRFNKKYLVGVTGLCSDLPFATFVGIKPFGAGGNFCVDRGDRVIMRGPGVAMHGPCTVTSIVPYTKEMEAADKAASEAKRHAKDEPKAN